MDPSRHSFESAGGVARHDTEGLRTGEAEVIERYCGGKRVLDLGCGTGRTTAHIQKVARSVVGIDYAEAMIARGRALHPTLDLRVMDARSLDFPSASFDTALFSFNGIDNLYPLAERERTLREVRRVLVAGGIFAYASHTERSRRVRSLRRLLGHVAGLLLGYRAPYVVHVTTYGMVVNCHMPPGEQEAMLAAAGFALFETIPVKGGEAMFIARAV